MKVYFFFYKRWRRFKKFLLLTDYLNIISFSFFFTKAEFPPILVAKVLVQQRNYLKSLKQLQHLLNRFYGVYCIYPIYSSLRLCIFGKIGGQKKRKFKKFLIKLGLLAAKFVYTNFLDFFFKSV